MITVNSQKNQSSNILGIVSPIPTDTTGKMHQALLNKIEQGEVTVVELVYSLDLQPRPKDKHVDAQGAKALATALLAESKLQSD